MESANNILEFTGFDYLTLKEFALDRNFQAFTLKGLKALTATIKSDINYFSSHNLIGFKKGYYQSDEFIIFMAHWDHLGLTDEGKDKIYNGAVDNATGVAGIIELAGRYLKI